MPGEFAEVAEKVHSMSADWAKSHEAVKGIDFSFVKLAASLGAWDAIKHVLGAVVKQTTAYQSIVGALSVEGLSQVRMMERRLKTQSEITRLTQEIDAAGITVLTEEQFLRGRLHEAQKSANTAQEKFLRILTEEGKVRLMAGGAILAITGDLLAKTKQFNQNLIEANASFSNRKSLMTDTLVLQAQTGASFERVTEAARALVHYGMDTEDTYSDNLRIVTQMEQGLGASTQSAAMLASVVERQVHGSFSKVADVVAQLVDDTSLAANEAVKLATSITQAMGRLSPGMGAAALPEIVKLVGRYEGALKEVGGAAGGFEQLVTKLTTTEGLVGAGALGVNPDFLATEHGVQQVMDRFAQFGERLVGQSRGWERQMRLDVLGQLFNTSAEQANQMLIAIKRAKTEQVGEITLQERWSRQLSATGQGLNRLYNSLLGLLQGALYPVIAGVNWLANTLADFVGFILQNKAVVYTGMVVAGAGMLVLALSMARLGVALWQTVLASNFAAAAQQRLATMTALANARSALGLAPGMAVGGGVGGSLVWVRGLFATLSLPLTLLVAGVAGAVYVLSRIYKTNKDAADANANAQKLLLSMQDRIDAGRHERLYAAARYGEGDVRHRMAQIYQEAGQKFAKIVDPNQRHTAMNQFIGDEQRIEGEMLARAILTRTQFKTLAQTSPEEQKYDRETLDATKEQTALARKMWQDAEKASARDAENRQDAEVQRAQHNAFMRWTGLGVASDYYSTIGSH